MTESSASSLALEQCTLLRTQNTEFFQERGVLLEREKVLGLHHEVLDHGWRAATDKTGHGVEGLDKIGWDCPHRRDWGTGHR